MFDYGFGSEVTSLGLHFCAGVAKLDSGPSTALPNTQLLLFVLERLQKYVSRVLGFCFAVPYYGVVHSV